MVFAFYDTFKFHMRCKFSDYFPKGIEQIGQMAGAGVLFQEVSDEGFQLLHIACQ